MERKREVTGSVVFRDKNRREKGSKHETAFQCEGQRSPRTGGGATTQKMTFSSGLSKLQRSVAKRRMGLILVLGPLVYMFRFLKLPSFDLNPSLHSVDKRWVREPFSITYYTYARPDRVGACLQDMLQGHAYAWHANQTYGGACINHTKHPERHQSLQKVIAALGLTSDLPLACPPPGQESTTDFPQLNDTHFILPTTVYRRKDTKIFSPQWLAYVRQKVRKAWYDYYATEGGTNHSTPSTAIQLAVHIRRGDVQPCNKNRERFLPISHYIDLIRTYLCEKKHSLPAESKVNITIFSEKKAGIEGWDGLRVVLEENKALATYNFALDTNIIDAFRHFVSADAIILSVSSFSLMGAVLNFKQGSPSPFNEIVYTPFWHAPLDSWTVVSHSQLIKTQREIQRLAYISGCSNDTSDNTALIGRDFFQKGHTSKAECE
jgi:hypothetical protein